MSRVFARSGLIGALALAGCAVGPRYVAPQPAPGATGQSSAIASPSAAFRLPTPGGPSNT